MDTTCGVIDALNEAQTIEKPTVSSLTPFWQRVSFMENKFEGKPPTDAEAKIALHDLQPWRTYSF